MTHDGGDRVKDENYRHCPTVTAS